MRRLFTEGRGSSAWRRGAWLAFFVLLGVRTAKAESPARLYVMDYGTKTLYIVSIADVAALATTTVTVGAPIAMQSQLNHDFRDIHLYTSRSDLLVESATGSSRLSYWTPDGVFKNTFGAGEYSYGLAVLSDGTFISHGSGASNYFVYAYGSTSRLYRSYLYDAQTNVLKFGGNGDYAARYGKPGFIFSRDGSPGNSHVFESCGGPGDGSHVVAIATGAAAPGNVTMVAPFPDGWAGTHSDNRWYAYGETLNASTQFPGTAVTGTLIPSTIADVSPLGEDHTAGLYYNTTNAQGQTVAQIQIWRNTDLALPVRTLDLGVNVVANSRLAGPLVVIPRQGFIFTIR